MQQITVSSLLRYLKNSLDRDNNLQKLYVSGEISNYHRHFSGHLYFTLKDETAAINCVMFKSAAASLSFEPKTGDKVIVYANTSIFETTGQLQLYILKMELDGKGDLYARYEALKRKLEQEGKFSSEHKSSLSKTYLDRVAVLVGERSAAMSDIRTTFQRRWPICKVDFYPVLVQGEKAAEDIIAKLIEVDKLDYDAIILARGGGSFEDLFCFNDERLANTIYDLKTFIVTGVGHEQDFTLVDFVADLRAATPTAAVELITPDIEEVKELIDEYVYDLNKSLNDALDRKKMLYDLYNQKLMHFNSKLLQISKQIESHVSFIKERIYFKIRYYNESIEHINNSLRLKLDLKLNNDKMLYKRLNTLLEAYSSENALKRGYTLVFQNGKLIKKRKDLIDKEFTIRFTDGEIQAIERK